MSQNYITTIACDECVWTGQVDGWERVGSVEGPDNCHTCGAHVDGTTPEEWDDHTGGSVYRKPRPNHEPEALLARRRLGRNRRARGR